MTDETTAPAPDGPLTQEHYRQLSLANERAKRIRNAAGVAAFNGWVLAIFAALSAPFAPFSLIGLIVTVGLIVTAFNEFRGRRCLLRFEPGGASLLGWNQVGLLALIVGYCLWMLVTTLAAKCPYAEELMSQREVADVVGDPDVLYHGIAILLYGSVIVLSVVFQGLNALYYFTRRKYVEAYLQETPAWVVELQRMGVAASPPGSPLG